MHHRMILADHVSRGTPPLVVRKDVLLGCWPLDNIPATVGSAGRGATASSGVGDAPVRGTAGRLTAAGKRGRLSVEITLIAPGAGRGDRGEGEDRERDAAQLHPLPPPPARRPLPPRRPPH